MRQVSADHIQQLCAPMIAEARAKKQMLFTAYHQLWFTPDQLAAAQAEGRFLWGPVNWQLRSTDEFLIEAKQALDAARYEYNRRQRIVSEYVNPY